MALSKEDIRAILRAADELIGSGGRTLLSKILKGSREKKVLELGLDKCPVYGYFKSKKMDDILQMIDWMIDYDFLDISYSGKLPMIVYTDRGWEIERDFRANEFLEEWNRWLLEGKLAPDMSYLKDRNRSMILLFLEKIRETGSTDYIPYLEEWEKIDYKKVRAEIRATIKALESHALIDEQVREERLKRLDEALEGAAPEDFYLKCWICGDRFLFSVNDQKFFKKMGFSYPKKCKKCRKEGW